MNEPSQAHKTTAATLDMNVLVGRVLVLGVSLSTLFIVAGLLVLPTHGGVTLTRLFDFPDSLGVIIHGVLAGHPQSIVSLGLLLLLATPVLRVAISIVTFAIEKDAKYVVITAFVLLVLLGSIIQGLANPGHSTTAHEALRSFTGMTIVIIGICSFAAGLLGSLVGLGGGIMVVPILTIFFHIPIRFAIGVSIVSVIATSSGAAAAYVRERVTNLRVGMFLEVGTTLGAVTGAVVAGFLSSSVLGIVFGVILLISVMPLIVKIGEELPTGVTSDRLAKWLNLASAYPDAHLKREVPYEVAHTPWGLAMMYVAGLVSGLLGIGSGTFKVIAMDTVMRLPMKVSTTTSNLMIGVTAAASAGIYFARGDIPPLLAAPVALGVLAGALLGARILHFVSNRVLRSIFIPVIVVAAVEMLLRSIGIGK